MGRFKKKFEENRVAEWNDQYLDYTGLTEQMEQIQKAVLDLLMAYGSIREITGSYK